MKLKNFQLGTLPQAVELTGLGRNWDLHNFVCFDGFTMNEEKRILELIWKVPSEVENNEAWGDPSNSASGCSLVFTGVDVFSISLKDIEGKRDSSLHGISKTIPGALNPTEGFKTEWDKDEDFNLLF